MLQRVVQLFQRWAVPVVMTLAYAFLAVTSETGAAVKAWMALGLVFVLGLWFAFRALAETAALSRAIRIGDTARLTELADRHLPRARRAAARAPLLAGRALAHLLRGEHAEAIAALDRGELGPALAPLAAVVRIAALVELGRPAEAARGFVVAAPEAPALGWLAEALVAWRADELDAAASGLGRVIDDVRVGSAIRAIAHLYLARITEVRGDAHGAARHRAAAAALAAPDAAWLRSAPAR